jgi:hypothetical protein
MQSSPLGALHLRHGLEPDGDARLRRSDRADLRRDVGDADGRRGARLRQAIPLHDPAAHAHPQKVLDMASQRRATRHNEPHPSAEALLDLAEDQLVEEGRGLVVLVPGVERVELPAESPVEQHLLQEPAGLDFLQDAGINAVKDAGNAGEEGRLERTDVFDEPLDVAPPVADRSTLADDELLGCPIEDMRERQVRDEHLLLQIKWAAVGREEHGQGGHGGHDARVRQLHPLGVARRPARVHDGAPRTRQSRRPRCPCP